ncbi:NADH-quinone oxidoreductase subunit C [candidate division WOR-3 bacterium]|nr:NADH-quinone oxidoreductase subunit C [candidate division WOR-3 bacterium]MCK4526633.1 NADH-quinone oxidoreductase subunit C [candidate division WOR-3 bacterium]
MATILNELKKSLGKKIIAISQPRDNRIYLRVAPEDIVTTIKYLFFDYKCKLATSTGLDTREGIEIIHHLCREDKNMVINVKTLVPYPNPSIESVGKEIPAFDWIERELNELLGVEFRGHPDMRRLLLADSFPKGKYPLRKDFQHSDVTDKDYDYKRSGI